MFHIQSLLSRCVITGNLLRCEPCPNRSRTEARSSLPCGSTPRILPVLTHLEGIYSYSLLQSATPGLLLRCEPCPSRSRTEARSSLPCGSTPRILPVLTHRSSFRAVVFFQVALLCSLLQASYAACYPLLRAIRIPPTMQARSSTLITSKGSRNWPFSVPIKVLPISFIGTSAVEGS